MQRFKGTRVHTYQNPRLPWPRIQGSKDTRLFRVGSDIPTLPTARPGNPELSRVQRFKGTRVHTYKNPRLQGSKDTRVQGYKVVWSRHPDTPDSPTRKPGAFKGPKVRRYKSPHIQESKVARVQGYKGPRIQGCLGLVPTTRSFQGCKSSKAQESTHTRIQGCQGPRIPGSKDTRLFRVGSGHPDTPDSPTRKPGVFKGPKVQRHNSAHIQESKVARVQGYKDPRIQGCLVPTSRHSRQPNPETRSLQVSKGSKVQQSTHTRIQAC